jgi:tryptophan synthase alpha chain
MSNRIDAKFAELKARGEKALITYLTAGDAGYSTTEKCISEMERAGADIIEIGVPFSDPIAEGPVIQAASSRALKRGTSLAGTFEMVKRIRTKTDMPLILMLYINSIFGFGTEKFFALCEEVGIDGVIVPDMPFEEKDEIQSFADAHGVINISLIAPTSRQRTAMIAAEAEGFVYCVSSVGVRGMSQGFATDFEEFIGSVRKASDTPCAIGFGISSPEAAKEMSSYADGVIVGSAIGYIVGEYRKDAPSHIYDFTRSLKDAIAI